MPKDEEVLEAIESQKARTQRQVRKKDLQVTSLTFEEDDDEEEETKLLSLEKKTITVGDKQIPMGSTPRLESNKKVRFKFTTKRPREE